MLSDNLQKIEIDFNDWDKIDLFSREESQFLNEPILTETSNRFVLFPIQYQEIWHAYKNAEAKFWSAEEIELSEDSYSFEKLSGKEKAFLMQAYSILTYNDRSLGQSIYMPFGKEIQIPEGRCYFGFLMMQENIHMELYNLFVQVFSERFLKSDNNKMIVDTKLAWIQHNILDSDEHFSLKIVSLAINRFIFSCSTDALLLQFASVKGTQKTIPLTRYDTGFPGIIKSTTKMMREKRALVRFIKVIVDIMVNKPSAKLVMSLMKQAVTIEKELFGEIMGLSGGDLVLNHHPIILHDLHAHIEFMANECMQILGFNEKVYPSAKMSPLRNVMSIYEIEREREGDDDIMESKAKILATKSNTNRANDAVEEIAFTLDADF